ncbi:zf-HC2 domain-containing protein [Actinomadura madurae]|uniref:zf-HC2 domain-containing protein n=1 Tax=Actinomadura madurae TaxID=1993 RepID=UPI003555D9B7
MTDSPACAETRRLLPELAAGVAPAEERARALRHIAGCGRCHRELEAQTALVDELLRLVPERQPPAGFEAAALAPMLRRAAAPAPAQRPRAGRVRPGHRRSVRRGGLAADRERPEPRRQLPPDALRRPRPVPADGSRRRGRRPAARSPRATCSPTRARPPGCSSR